MTLYAARNLLKRNFAAARDDREPREVAYKITKEIAAKFAPLIAAELKAQLRMSDSDVVDFMDWGAKYPHYPFQDYLAELLEEQASDFIRENYRAD